jgi:hypothetical protein
LEAVLAQDRISDALDDNLSDEALDRGELGRPCGIGVCKCILGCMSKGKAGSEG